MKAPEIPADEEKRLRKLWSYGVLDTPPEKTFDEITNLAARMVGTNIALVSLVDQDRQWFKSCTGLSASETPRGISFCGHAILDDEIFEIQDATKDERFCDNPLVTGEPHVRFYAGVPLITPDGFRVGTLCVIHDQPKTLTSEQREILRSFSRHVVDILELHKKTMEVQAFAKLYDQSFDAISTVHPPDWRFTWGNPAAIKLFGANSLEHLCSLEPWAISPEFQPDGERSEAKGPRMIQKAMEEGNHFFEWLHRKIDGTLVPCNVLLSRVNQGKGSYLLATTRDIGKQKTLEAQLIEAQSISKIGSWTYDLRTKEQVWSEEHYKIFEIAPDQPKEELFRLYRQRIHPDDLPGLELTLENALKNDTATVYDHRVVLDGGKRIKFVQGISKVFRDADGNPMYLRGTCRDRTEDFKNEDRYRLLLEENRFILDSLGIGVWKVNLKTGNQIWDKTVYSLYGMDHSDTASSDRWLSLLTPASREKVHQQMSDILAGSDSFSSTIEILTPSGERRFLGSRGMSIRDSHGVPVSLHGINWDRTKEVELEKSLDTERARSLHTAKLASIGQLAAGVGHEINNPLAIISGLLTVVDYLLKDGAPVHEIRERFATMESSIVRISNIVKGLRTFARSDSSEISEFNPFLLVHETVDLLKEIYASEEIEIILEKQALPVLLRANRGRLQQVLVNLISNAKDATTGKKLRTIRVEARLTGQEFHLVVSDNGHGIPEEIRDHIFEPFFTTKNVNEGTGLGLSLVNTIVKEHGGRIDLTSRPGEGSEFRVIIPATVSPELTNPAALEKKAPKTVKIPGRILIVDDEPVLCALLAEILSHSFEEVFNVSGAREALEFLAKSKVNVVLSDIKMPGMDGFEFLRQIRRNSDLKEMKFFFITGGVSKDYTQEVETLGVDGIFYKPLKVPEVIEKIKEILVRC